LLGLEIGNPDLHAINLITALGYLTKGVDPAAAERCNVLKLEPGGRVIGKRCGTSQNIGPKARKDCDGRHKGNRLRPHGARGAAER
jgi:hypothetical protein